MRCRGVGGPGGVDVTEARLVHRNQDEEEGEIKTLTNHVRSRFYIGCIGDLKKIDREQFVYSFGTSADRKADYFEGSWVWTIQPARLTTHFGFR